jgi:hypothetical protein
LLPSTIATCGTRGAMRRMRQSTILTTYCCSSPRRPRFDSKTFRFGQRPQMQTLPSASWLSPSTTKAETLNTLETLFDRSLRHRAETAGARTLAAYVSSQEENNFPRLPIRVGEHIFVWVAQFANPGAYAAYQSKLAADKLWNQTRWRDLITRDPEVLRLTPTPRSRLRG